jgi:solute carrier family 50 protein (sugar transporter)
VLSATALACSFTWFIFGWTLGDPFIMVPNLFGIVLSSLQLALVQIYGQHPEKELAKEFDV